MPSGFLKKLRKLGRETTQSPTAPLPLGPSDRTTGELHVEERNFDPQVGMYSVLSLNGFEILVRYTHKLPYTLPGIDSDDSSYHFVQPKPHNFEVKCGKKFTVFVGNKHYVAEIMKVLDSPLRPELVVSHRIDRDEEHTSTSAGYSNRTSREMSGTEPSHPVTPSARLSAEGDDEIDPAESSSEDDSASSQSTDGHQTQVPYPIDPVSHFSSPSDSRKWAEVDGSSVIGAEAVSSISAATDEHEPRDLTQRQKAQNTSPRSEPPTLQGPLHPYQQTELPSARPDSLVRMEAPPLPRRNQLNAPSLIRESNGGFEAVKWPQVAHNTLGQILETPTQPPVQSHEHGYPIPILPSRTPDDRKLQTLSGVSSSPRERPVERKFLESIPTEQYPPINSIDQTRIAEENGEDNEEPTSLGVRVPNQRDLPVRQDSGLSELELELLRLNSLQSLKSQRPGVSSDVSATQPSPIPFDITNPPRRLPETSYWAETVPSPPLGLSTSLQDREKVWPAVPTKYHQRDLTAQSFLPPSKGSSPAQLYGAKGGTQTHGVSLMNHTEGLPYPFHMFKPQSSPLSGLPELPRQASALRHQQHMSPQNSASMGNFPTHVPGLSTSGFRFDPFGASEPLPHSSGLSPAPQREYASHTPHGLGGLPDMLGLRFSGSPVPLLSPLTSRSWLQHENGEHYDSPSSPPPLGKTKLMSLPSSPQSSTQQGVSTVSQASRPGVWADHAHSRVLAFASSSGYQNAFYMSDQDVGDQAYSYRHQAAEAQDLVPSRSRSEPPSGPQRLTLTQESFDHRDPTGRSHSSTVTTLKYDWYNYPTGEEAEPQERTESRLSEIE